MKNFIMNTISVYFWSVSRIFPAFSAQRALKLMFTVDTPKTIQSNIPAPDELLRLPSGAHLYKWKGNGQKTVLLVHGWNGSFEDFKELFRKLVERNMTIYGVSPAGYGPSNEEISHPKLFVDAIIEAQHSISKTIDVGIGHSMGAGALALAASQCKIANKLILISSPSSFLDVVKRFAFAIKLGRRAKRLFLDQVEILVGKHNEVEVAEKVRLLDVPCTIIHDIFDSQVPYTNALRLADNIKYSTLYPTENMGHKRLLSSYTICELVLSKIARTAE
ncbi:alpha/beta hydrolase [Alteromonas sp. ASW11-36]|uniref:Alpha/beta hydrolase n=1 Tax=Alteromonas arenosi TaxID=3055817 RepID=A0ABT7SY98_9ALTE|nr:alpha/beta hydrolase [Alteromonas sp. ASW11-36]MDM7861157.1 alpha/beta hydrolase [Alteromonas sp. ASW11-36]